MKSLGKWWPARTVLFFVLASTTAVADELPKELLLQCEGEFRSVTTLGKKTETDEGKFNITLRLKDRTVRNIKFTFLEGKDCVLQTGDIHCELNSTAYVKELNVTSKEHRTVSINRATGELGLFLESWGYDGQRASGTPSSIHRLSRIGVCRPSTRGPIF